MISERRSRAHSIDGSRLPWRSLSAMLGCLLLAAPLAAQQASDRSAADGSSFHEQIWWNQEKKIEALGLSPEVRQKMDAELDEFLAVRREYQGSKSMTDFAAAAETGDWEAAATAADRVADGYSVPLRAQLQLIIDVASMLTPEQRDIIQEQFPRMLQRPWVRTARLPQGRMQGKTRGGGEN